MVEASAETGKPAETENSTKESGGNAGGTDTGGKTASAEDASGKTGTTDSGEPKPKSRFNPARRSRCRFCQDGVGRVDYKDVQNLQNLVSAQGKIVSRRRSGNCARHQRMAQKAIKQARYIGLLSYTEGQARGKLGGRF